MRVLALTAVITLVLSGVGVATPIVVPPEPEQLVEGHTVFTVVEIARVVNTSKIEFAAAVAVLVRERIQQRTAERFPGVLWFNDQYLTNPSSRAVSRTDFRHPCTGAVIATDAGDITAVDYDVNGYPTIVTATYGMESYLITDPNEHTWIVDLWNTSYGSHLWSVAIMNNQVGSATPDNGSCGNGVYSDRPCTYSSTPVTGERCDRSLVCDPDPILNQGCVPDRVEDPRRVNTTGENGQTYRPVQYNALLYMRLHHLNVTSAPKNHTEHTGADWLADTSACEVGSNWPCPGNNDDREGNSHPFNPETTWPINRYDGRNNHGGSDDCDGDAAYEMFCHATRRIDIYYGYVVPPFVRNFVLIDTMGADAPYHCHATVTLCGDEL